uniref:Uncharacterized protein n=1 Tax=Oryza punctata TaxID=4537 RepID=A0A0E0JS56_ORYPU
MARMASRSLDGLVTLLRAITTNIYNSLTNDGEELLLVLLPAVEKKESPHRRLAIIFTTSFPFHYLLKTPNPFPLISLSIVQWFAGNAAVHRC